MLAAVCRGSMDAVRSMLGGGVRSSWVQPGGEVGWQSCETAAVLVWSECEEGTELLSRSRGSPSQACGFKVELLSCALWCGKIPQPRAISEEQKIGCAAVKLELQIRKPQD